MKKRAPTTWVRAAGFRYLLKCVELHEARLPSRSFVSRVLASFQENELDICFAVTTFWGATKKNAVLFSLGIHNKYIYLYIYIHIYIYDSVYEGNNLMVGNDPWVLRFSFYGLVLGISDFWKFARRRLVWCMAQRSTDGNSDDLAWLSGPKEKGSLSPPKNGVRMVGWFTVKQWYLSFCTEKTPYSYLWESFFLPTYALGWYDTILLVFFGVLKGGINERGFFTSQVQPYQKIKALSDPRAKKRLEDGWCSRGRQRSPLFSG